MKRALGGAHLAHGRPVLRRSCAAARALPVILRRIEIHLLDLHRFPIDIQLFRDDHGQHGANALADFRILGHDGHRAIRRHANERVWIDGGLRASTALRLSFGFHVEAEGDAAARERADSQK